jgi:E3 ubiquitin-protein ligase BRE1
MQLSSWDKEELDDKLANRVQVSKRAVSKVVQAFDRLSQRNEKITLALKGEFDGKYDRRIVFVRIVFVKKYN